MSNTNNDIVLQKMASLQACIAELNEKGAVIVSAVIKDTKPIITIATLSETPAGLQGGMVHQFIEHGRMHERYATIIEGCQVEWVVPKARVKPVVITRPASPFTYH